MRKRWLPFLKSALVFVLGASVSWAQSPASLSWQFDLPATLRVGDRVRFALSVSDPDWKVAIPEFEAKNGWMLLPAPDLKSTAQVFECVPTRAGDLQIPELEVKDTAGVVVAKIQPVQLSVQSAIAQEDPQPKQPDPMLDARAITPPWGWVALAALVSLVALYFGVRAGIRAWRARQARVKPLAAPTEKLTEDEWALRELSRVRELATWKSGKFKPHYFRVSEILKIYIERRYQIDAVESTSVEVIRALEGQGVQARWVDLLESHFYTLDRVKFTDYVPTAEEPNQIIEDTIQWVKSTRRVVLEVDSK